MQTIIDVTRNAESITVRPTRDLIGSEVERVRKEIMALLGDTPKILIIDASALKMVSSLGIGLLIDLSKSNSRMTIIRTNKNLYNMFTAMNLDRHLNIECIETLAEQEENKRKRLRVPFTTRVFLTADVNGERFEARMNNISMGGIYLMTDTVLPMGARYAIEVVLTAPTSSLTMKTNGGVCRHDDGGFGLKFDSDIEWLSLFSMFSHYGKAR